MTKKYNHIEAHEDIDNLAAEIYAHDGVILESILRHHYSKRDIYNTHDGTYLYLNDNIKDVLGFSTSRYVGKGVPVLETRYSLTSISDIIAGELDAEMHKPTYWDKLRKKFLK